MADQKSNSNPAAKVKIEKVSPYPIDCMLIMAEGKPPFYCKIIRLEDVGLIIKATKHLFRPGEQYKCEFEVPVLDVKVFDTIKVIKTYEKVEAYLATGTKERVMTVEAHFKSLTPDAKQAIRSFILKIGQKKL